jgi:hypothetical protein
MKHKTKNIPLSENESPEIEHYGYKDISQFKKGDRVKLECYNKGCSDIFTYAILKDDGEPVHPTFTGNGRFHWGNIEGAQAKAFYLSEPYRCGGCGTLFSEAVIVYNPLQKKDPNFRFTLFGYESEPA